MKSLAVKNSNFAAALLGLVLTSVVNASVPAVSEISFGPSPVTSRLSQQVVEEIAQDSTGAMWFATQEGLNRYDGRRVEEYGTTAAPTGGLSSSAINSLAVSSDGRLWVATNTLQVFDTSKRLFVEPNAFNSVAEITAMAAGDQNQIWLGFPGAIGIYDIDSDEYRELALPTPFFSSSAEIKDILFLANGRVLAIVEGRGLFEFKVNGVDLRVIEIFTTEDLASSDLFTVEEVGSEVWIGTLGQGIFTIDLSNGLTRHLTSQVGDGELPSDTIHKVFVEDERVWIATGEGLAVTVDWGRTYSVYTAFNDGLPNDYVYTIEKSSDGSYWVGTYSGLTQGRESIFQTLNNSNANLAIDDVNAIHVGNDGTLWVGTDAGVSFMPVGELTFRQINSASHPVLGDDIIMTLTTTTDSLWIGTLSAGLYRYVIAEGTMAPIPVDPRSPFALHHPGVTALLFHSSGHIVASTFGGGVSIVRSDGKVIRTIHAAPGEEENDLALALLEDIDGSVLVGTEAGVAQLDADLTKLVSLPIWEVASQDSNEPTVGALIWDLQHARNDNSVWLGSRGGGLYQLRRDPTGDLESVRNLTKQLDLPSKNILGMHYDSDGYLWLSHNAGLSRVDENSLRAEHFSTQVGLRKTEFNMGASFGSPSGRVYFGSDSGVNTLERLRPDVNSNVATLGLSSIHVMDRFLELPGPNEPFILELDHEDKLTTIEVFAVDYTAPENVEYKYRILGLRDEWESRGQERTVSLTTLPPGDYVLQFAVKGLFGGWNYSALEIPIIAHPKRIFGLPDYYVYSTAAFLLLILVAWRARENSLAARRREIELADRVRARTIDMEEAKREAEEANRAKSEFLAVMSHEIRTPLHGMIGMNELLLNTRITAQQERFTRAALNSGKTLLHLINEVLDLAKIEAQRIEIERTHFDLTKLIDEVCYLQGEPAQRKGLQLDIIPEPELPKLFFGDVQKIRQIVTNLVGNAIKFTDKGRVTVRVYRGLDDEVVISVQDTGIGIDPTARERIFDKFTQVDASTTRKYGGTGLGLTISRNFATLMGGELVIGDTRDGKGTLIQVSLPLETIEAVELSPDKVLALLTDDDLLAEAIAAQAIRLGYVAERCRGAGELINAPFDAVVADEQLAPSILDALESDKSLVHLVLMTSIRSLSPRLIGRRWLGLHKPVTGANLDDALTVDALRSSQNSSRYRFNGRVLCVEDNPVNQLLAREMMEGMGLEVVIADDGAKAVNLFMAGQFDLILMDCEMPVMDGFEATRLIRKFEADAHRLATPIIAATAASQSGESEKAFAAGMSDFMTKPYSTRELGGLLSRYLDGGAVDDDFADDSHTADPTENLIREEALQNILRISPERGPELLARVIATFSTQLPGSLEALEACIDDVDSETLRKRAHALKSAALNIGADKLGSVLAELERAAREDAYILVPSEFSALRDLAEASLAEAQRLSDQIAA